MRDTFPQLSGVHVWRGSVTPADNSSPHTHASATRTTETGTNKLNILERIVEKKSEDNRKNNDTLALFVQLPRSNRRKEFESKSGVLRRFGQAWTALLLCVVVTLVLVNDMNTYGGSRQGSQGHGMTGGASNVTNTSLQHEVEAFPPMRVEVYYEALCPDSRYFVVKHLLPTYNKLKDIMTVVLVPYGKASTHEKEGRYSFKCQHGPVECRANTVHACVTNLIKDETTQLQVVSCMIEKNDNPMKAGQRCVEKFGEQWEGVETCVTGDNGESILKHMGDMTHALKPPVTFIPTIIIDGSQTGQAKILQDLHKFLCRKYKGTKPATC